MKHVLVGYGYCAAYVAEQLAHYSGDVEVYARQLKAVPSPDISFICKDVISEGLNHQPAPFYLYYFISPPNTGHEDTCLASFLSQTDLSLCQGIAYISSSAVYGDHQGAAVDEQSDCPIQSDRQARRLHAEQQMIMAGKNHEIPALILRCAGIYGLGRLPVKAAKQQQAIIQTNEAPLTNLIYVKDLAYLTPYLLTNQVSGVFNVADGEPKPSGYLQQTLAKKLGFPAAPQYSYQNIYDNASPMKRFFMQSSKQLVVDKIQAALPKHFQFTKVEDALHQIIDIQGEL